MRLWVRPPPGAPEKGGDFVEVFKILKYTPTEEEKSRGLRSSVKSEGLVGVVNRTIARIARQEEVDFVAFADHWNPLRTED